MKKVTAKKGKFCITFAGAIGCSKTPIANFLSPKLNLPVYNNDAVRSEVIEDLGIFDAQEYIARRNAKIEEIIKSGISFICDASIDREWLEFKKQLIANHYRWFIISLDLSKELLIKLYKAKGYFESLERIDELMQDHETFLQKNVADVGARISDNGFLARCQISYDKIVKWINNGLSGVIL